MRSISPGCRTSGTCFRASSLSIKKWRLLCRATSQPWRVPSKTSALDRRCIPAPALHCNPKTIEDRQLLGFLVVSMYTSPSKLHDTIRTMHFRLLDDSTRSIAFSSPPTLPSRTSHRKRTVAFGAGAYSARGAWCAGDNQRERQIRRSPGMINCSIFSWPAHARG